MFLKDEGKRALLLMSVSFVSLAVSFFNISALPIDAAWFAVLLCGIPIVKGAVVGLVTKFDIKADMLVSIALIASVIIGEVFAAGEVAFIMTIGAYLEERTVAKARAGVERLVSLKPVTARLIRGAEESIVNAGEVKPGDTLRVLAGETIPVDGVITKGRTSIDQSVMTGESLPVDKGEGDAVLSGTVNQFGAFDMAAQKTGENSSLQRMIRLVEQADAGKAKIVGLADRWATWIVVIALAAAGVTWFVTGEVIRSVTILVVFCPCALVLATPTAVMAGIGNAAKHGILVSRGDALERLASVSRIAFDKTGTLTYGKPAVVQVRSFDPLVNERELLAIAAAVELRSEHPLGKAIVSFHKQERDKLPFEPLDFELIPGKGVSASVNGRRILAGNEALLKDAGMKLADGVSGETTAAASEGATLIYLADERGVIGFIALADTLRPDAVHTIKALHAINTETVLLTGDSRPAAERIAVLSGVAEVKCNCLPEDKLAAIAEYQRAGERVCMVGDGVNDALALKAASVGIAMGGVGSDIAIEAADIVLVGDDIKEIHHLILLSKRLMRTIAVNLSASMLLNFAAVVLAIMGVLNPILGALVHNAGSVAVICNSALLLHAHPSQAKPVRRLRNGRC
ncbi:MAG: cation-translocating P-type ATPase [Treponema sp.]|jgi:heavy metal translocating P-type ATPase|nr:cation-translocating P-type ATPase [Treponema sp.]